MPKITKDTTLAEIMNKKGAEKILAKHQLPCLGCPMAAFEIKSLKLGDVAKAYGLDINGLLKDLNKEEGSSSLRKKK